MRYLLKNMLFLLTFMFLTSCGSADTPTPKSENPAENTTIDSTVKTKIVERHNHYRSLVFSDSDLVWDETLALHAQTWANYLAENFKKSDVGVVKPHATTFQTELHTEDDYMEGENIAWSNYGRGYLTENPVDISSVNVASGFVKGSIDAWAVEKAYYDYARNTQKLGYENEQIGHYTQLVWQKTKKVGCALANSNTDKGGEWVVCRYAEPGNYTEQKPYCANYTVSDLFTNNPPSFSNQMINNKSFSITKVLENRADCTRRDNADSSLIFTGTASANIANFDAFNNGDDSNLWDLNFNNVTIQDGEMTLTNSENNRYMTLKIIGETSLYYTVEAYWWVITEELYNRRAFLKLAKN